MKEKETVIRKRILINDVSVAFLFPQKIPYEVAVNPRGYKREFKVPYVERNLQRASVIKKPVCRVGSDTEILIFFKFEPSGKLPGKKCLRKLAITPAWLSLSRRSVSPFPLQIYGNANLR